MKSTYLVYLDEFGHVGPYISREDPQYNTFPVFGFGGIALPSDRTREFSDWFYDLKCKLLEFEITRSGLSPRHWEKKGAALYTTTNVEKYDELRKATFRLLNKITSVGGFVFYVGIEKQIGHTRSNPTKLTLSMLRQSIIRLDNCMSLVDGGFLLFLDHREEKPLREAVLSVTIKAMHPPSPRKSIIDAPTQVESHLYQVMQASDWICGILGRLESYRSRPDQYPDWAWRERYFGKRIDSASRKSGVRMNKRAGAPNTSETSL